MANQNKLATWLIQNKSLLNPKVTSFDWPNRFFSGLHDFETRISVNGIEARGRGLSDNQDLALEKSIAEAIERLICRNLNISSIGVAVSGAESAKIHAKNEALERYYLKKHMDMEVSFPALLVERLPELNVKNVMQKFKSVNTETEIRFYSMSLKNPSHGIICEIKIQDKRQFFGFSLHQNINSAIQSSFFEAVSNFAFYKDDPGNFDAEIEGSKDLWHLQPEFISKISPLLGCSEKGKLDEPNVKVESINLSGMDELLNCPIEPIRAFISEEAL